MIIEINIPISPPLSADALMKAGAILGATSESVEVRTQDGTMIVKADVNANHEGVITTVCDALGVPWLQARIPAMRMGACFGPYHHAGYLHVFIPFVVVDSQHG